MADADEDDDDDADAGMDECVKPQYSMSPDSFALRYSDDEDTSYKIRRSATKLLAGIIATRPELLITMYKDVSPVLISRFGDREETVRLEVWATYVILLNQTSVYGGGSSKDETPRGKRKRDTETMDVEEGPYTLLKGQVPSLSKALLNQLKSSKTSVACLQAGFGLLRTLLDVLPGSLSNQVSTLTTTSKTILAQPPTTSTSSLQLACLSFLGLFYSTHSPPTFTSSLGALVPVLQRSIGEKHPRIAAESFRVFSSLLNALKPVKNSDWTEVVYTQAVTRLSSNDTDAEVRSTAEDCIADLWICATDLTKTKNRKEWEAICRSTGKTENAVKVVTKVAKEVQIGDDWVNGCVEWLLNLLRKSARAGKTEIFSALEVLLKRCLFCVCYPSMTDPPR